MARPRKAPPLPAPFDRAPFRQHFSLRAHVCEATVIRWVAGNQSVSDNYCHHMVDACQTLGIVPPAGAKLPDPIAPAPSTAAPVPARLASVPPAKEGAL